MTAEHEASPPATQTPNALISLSETDPVIAGLQVVDLFYDSAKNYVEACFVIARVADRHHQSSQEFAAFIGVLIEAKVVSRREGNRGAKSSKLSKLRKIGENRDLLLCPGMSRCVELGYTVAYQACLLFDALPGSSDEKKAALASRIESAQDLSKEFLVEETARVKAMGDAGSNAGSLRSSPDESTNTPLLNLSGIDGLLATPSQKDIRVLAENYADDATLFRCLPMHERVADDATLVVITKIIDIPTIATRLLPCCGFKRLSHVLLVRQPPSSEVTDFDVVIIANRGEVEPLLLTDWTWLDAETTLDPISIANRILLNSERRVHMFASAQAEGWQSLIGDAAWIEKPSIK
jgi:hypothetical protein